MRESLGSFNADPSGKFLYVPTFSAGLSKIYGYAISPNGSLVPIHGMPIEAKNTQLNSVAVEPTGKFAYALDQMGYILAYEIAGNGALKHLAGSPFSVEFGSLGFAIDPRGEYLYIAATDEDNVEGYSLGRRGALTQVPGSPFRADSPPSIVIDPTGNFAYTGSFDSSSIFAYIVSRNGTLTPIAGSPFAAINSPAALAVESRGRFLYALTYNFDTGTPDNKISAYSIGSTGALTPIAGTFPTVTNPSGIAADPEGNFIYFVTSSNSVSGYKIGSDGTLTPVPGSPFPAGNGARGVAIAAPR